VLNPYGIPEPDGAKVLDAAELDAVLVPLLGFDEKRAARWLWQRLLRPLSATLPAGLFENRVLLF
jgi:hypothetical protein